MHLVHGANPVRSLSQQVPGLKFIFTPLEIWAFMVCNIPKMA
jgi:hypothetical protein